jgi:hypothetical protein
MPWATLLTIQFTIMLVAGGHDSDPLSRHFLRRDLGPELARYQDWDDFKVEKVMPPAVEDVAAGFGLQGKCPHDLRRRRQPLVGTIVEPLRVEAPSEPLSIPDTPLFAGLARILGRSS